MTLVGLTALSVEIITNESVWYSMARSASCRVAVDDVPHRFLGMLLHQRNVLVGGGVEDHVRPVLHQDAAHARLVEHVGDADVDLLVAGQRPQFPFQEELARLRAVDQHDPLRGELQQLPADFRADAAGAAGDQDHPAVDPLADVLDVQLHRLALQQVFDGDRPRLDGDAAFDQLPVVGHHADLAGAAAGVVHELAQLRRRRVPPA